VSTGAFTTLAVKKDDTVFLIKEDNTLWVMGGNYRDTLGYDIKAMIKNEAA